MDPMAICFVSTNVWLTIFLLVSWCVVVLYWTHACDLEIVFVNLCAAYHPTGILRDQQLRVELSSQSVIQKVFAYCNTQNEWH